MRFCSENIGTSVTGADFGVFRRFVVSELAARTGRGPNLQNFVKCTYENVTREFRIVS